MTAVFIIVDEIYHVWMKPEQSVSWEPRRETGLFVEEAGRVQRFRGYSRKLSEKTLMPERYCLEIMKTETF